MIGILSHGERPMVTRLRDASIPVIASLMAPKVIDHLEIFVADYLFCLRVKYRLMTKVQKRGGADDTGAPAKRSKKAAQAEANAAEKPAFYLLKSEPHCFSLDDLANSPEATTEWDGVPYSAVMPSLRIHRRYSQVCSCSRGLHCETGCNRMCGGDSTMCRVVIWVILALDRRARITRESIGAHCVQCITELSILLMAAK
jgi:hypothetical protein